MKRMLLIALILNISSSCLLGEEPAKPEMTTHIFRGIRPTDPSGRNGLRNPERGFRTETLIAEPAGRTNGVWGIPAHLWNRVGPGFNRMNWVMDMQNHEADGVTLAQTYCYLTEHHDEDIPANKLRMLQDSFDTMRKLGMKCVLRFAYIKNYPLITPAPDTQRILGHMKQLKPILWRNQDVIHVFEAGFIGAWGEWHSGKHTPNNERPAILEETLKLVPPSIFVQVRYPGAKTSLVPTITGAPYRSLSARNAFTDIPEARIGHHDDGVLTYPKGETSYRYAREPAKYGNLQEFTKAETLFTPMGGELFWTDQAWYGDGKYHKTFDGLKAAILLRDYHFNVFSLAHSYSEREGKALSIDHWRSSPITKEQLEKARLPISKDWFTDILGQPVKRTQFEYIRDHLGYRIELQKASFSKELKPNQDLVVDLSLINRGFSTLFSKRPVIITLVDIYGKVFSFPTEADPRRWFPHKPSDKEYTSLVHTITLKRSLPRSAKPGHYMLGLWLPDRSKSLLYRFDYAIRVANGDVPFWKDIDGKYGINLLGVVQINDPRE